MRRVPTVLHLLIAHDDIIKQLANYSENYKFFVYACSMLQKYAIGCEVIVTSHPEIVSKSSA